MAPARPAHARRLALLVALLIAFAAAPAVSAQTAALNAEAFRKLASAQLKTLKPLPVASAKEVGAELKALVAQVKSGESNSPAALSLGIATVNSAAAALATAAADAATALRDEALALEGDISGRDFRAGGRGTWDKFLADADAQLTRADQLFAKELEKFRKGLEQATAASGGVDIHLGLRDHDRRLYLVVPPASFGVAPPGDGDPKSPRPAQVYIIATVLESMGTPYLGLGLQAHGLTDFDLDLVTTEGTESFPEQPIDDFGAAYFGTSLGSPTGGPVRVDINPDPVLGPDDRVGIRRPSLTETADFKPELKQFKQQLTADFKFFLKFSGEKLSGFRKQAKGTVGLHSKGVFTGFETLQGLYDLSDTARNAMGFSFQLALHNPTVAACNAFVDADLDDALVPDDLALWGGGRYQKYAQGLNDAHRKRNAVLDRLFDVAVGKVAAKAAKSGEALDFASLRLRVPFLMGSVATSEDDPVAQVRLEPQATEALIINVSGGGETFVSGIFGGYLQNGESVVPTVTAIAGDDIVVLSDISTGTGHVSTVVPVLSEIPLLGRLFSLDRDADKRRSLLLVTTPALVSPIED